MARSAYIDWVRTFDAAFFGGFIRWKPFGYLVAVDPLQKVYL